MVLHSVRRILLTFPHDPYLLYALCQVQNVDRFVIITICATRKGFIAYFFGPLCGHHDHLGFRPISPVDKWLIISQSPASPLGDRENSGSC
jgi:hypothetical protein